MSILKELLHRMWKPNIIGIIARSAASQDQPRNTEGKGKMSDSKVEHYRECLDCQRAYYDGYRDGFYEAIEPTVRSKMLQFEPNIVDTRTPPSGGEEKKPLDCGMSNVDAYRLGLVVVETQKGKIGDEIDRGLILCRILKEKGYSLIKESK